MPRGASITHAKLVEASFVEKVGFDASVQIPWSAAMPICCFRNMELEEGFGFGVFARWHLIMFG